MIGAAIFRRAYLAKEFGRLFAQQVKVFLDRHPRLGLQCACLLQRQRKISEAVLRDAWPGPGSVRWAPAGPGRPGSRCG